MVTIDKDVIFGIHSVAVLDRSNGFLPYEGGYLEILGNVNFNSTIENIPLTGGSSLDPWEVENGLRNTEIGMTVRQANKAQWQTFAGAVASATAASSTGTVGTIINTKGTSVVNATTGIASIAATSGDEADLKTGTYFFKAASATTVDIYVTTDIDFNEGTDVVFDDQSLLIESGVTVSGTGGTTAIADFGLTITGGSGTVAMTADDVAAVTVRREHGGLNKYLVGQGSEVPEYVGLEFYSQKQADGTEWMVRFPKVKANGMPVAFNEKAWTEAEITANAVRALDPIENTSLLYVVEQIKGA